MEKYLEESIPSPEFNTKVKSILQSSKSLTGIITTPDNRDSIQSENKSFKDVLQQLESLHAFMKGESKEQAPTNSKSHADKISSERSRRGAKHNISR